MNDFAAHGARVRQMRLLLLSTVLLVGLSFDACGQLTTVHTTNPFRDWDQKTVLVITPHPDDDIIGCGGALAYLAGRHNHVIAVFLTDGEKGSLDATMTPDVIRQVRRREAANAYTALGFRDTDLVWVDYGDGQLDFAPQREVRMRLTQILRRYRPDVVFSVDPGLTYYRYHYRDHRTAALAGADAIGTAMWPLEYPELGPPFSVPHVFFFYTAEPTLTLDITEVYGQKLKALAQHRSQFPPAETHYTPEGPAPLQTDMEHLLRPLAGSLTTEAFRQR